MRLDDMILISVDDHVVEPPDLFERHLAQKWHDVAPQLVHKDDGTDVWGYEAAIDTRTVDTHVRRLREKLGKRGDLIETVRGFGYRFRET